MVCFLIFNVIGGDPAYALAGKNATPEQITSIRAELGLNQHLAYQYLDFLKQTFTADWGHSWHTREKITDMLWKGVGPSLSLTLPAFLLSFLISLAFALYTTLFKNTWKDKLLTVSCLAFMSISFLVYIIAYQYVFAFKLNFFPVSGWDPSWFLRWQYLFLPWLISVSVTVGPNILIYRSTLIDEVSQDYVVTAKAKGINNKTLYLKHILKNAMIPISTIVIMQIPFLLTGSLLLEAFFGIPGLGGLMIQAIHNSDFPVIKAMTVLGSITYMAFNILTDFAYTIFDPRVSLK